MYCKMISVFFVFVHLSVYKDYSTHALSSEEEKFTEILNREIII